MSMGSQHASAAGLGYRTCQQSTLGPAARSVVIRHAAMHGDRVHAATAHAAREHMGIANSKAPESCWALYGATLCNQQLR